MQIEIAILRGAAALACLVELAGCGGGGGGSPSSCIFISCPSGPIPATPPTPHAFIAPERQSAQVGTSITFTANIENFSNPSYAWCREGASAACVAMPEVTGGSLTLPSVNLGDDGARFRVTVTGAEGAVTTGFARLSVSPMPGVAFEDGEFLESDWSVQAIVVPAQNGPTFTAARLATGGNPGAYRTATYDMTTTQPGLARILYSGPTYFPTSQGAILVIDFTEDCNTTSLSFGPALIPLIEQGGRRYIASNAAAGCTVNGWSTRMESSIAREEFVLVDGPACGSGESCPDFSASAAPIRLGIAGSAELTTSLPSTGPAVAHFAHGIDNWKATVWRR